MFKKPQTHLHLTPVERALLVKSFVWNLLFLIAVIFSTLDSIPKKNRLSGF